MHADKATVQYKNHISCKSAMWHQALAQLKILTELISRLFFSSFTGEAAEEMGASGANP